MKRHSSETVAAPTITGSFPPILGQAGERERLIDVEALHGSMLMRYRAKITCRQIKEHANCPLCAQADRTDLEQRDGSKQGAKTACPEDSY